MPAAPLIGRELLRVAKCRYTNVALRAQCVCVYMCACVCGSVLLLTVPAAAATAF